MKTQAIEVTGLGKAQAESKRRRLGHEVENLMQLVRNTKDMIKHDPYKEDLPSLKQQLKDAQFDLENARREWEDV